MKKVKRKKRKGRHPDRPRKRSEESSVLVVLPSYSSLLASTSSDRIVVMLISCSFRRKPDQPKRSWLVNDGVAVQPETVQGDSKLSDVRSLAESRMNVMKPCEVEASVCEEG
jgi:hypothetical protein